VLLASQVRESAPGWRMPPSEKTCRRQALPRVVCDMKLSGSQWCFRRKELALPGIMGHYP